MSTRKDDKLNRLLTTVPEGVAIPSPWLTANGYSPQLVRKYVQSGWLVRLASRVYARPGEPVGWEGALLGLQRLAEVRLHLGGVSALQRQGLAHYLPLADKPVIDLWGQARVPGWLDALEGAYFWDYHRRRLFSVDPPAGWVALPTNKRDWTLRASAPERAILEVLSEVGESESAFTYAAELFEGMTTARPAAVTALLQACTHHKAKRLFLFLATYYHPAWLKRLDLETFDLGHGRRLVTRGGRLDRRFEITVPEDFHAR